VVSNGSFTLWLTQHPARALRVGEREVKDVSFWFLIKNCRLKTAQLCGLPNVWETEGRGWQSLYTKASQTSVYINSTCLKMKCRFPAPTHLITVGKSSMRSKRLILIRFSVILSLESPTVLLCLGLQNFPGFRTFSLGQTGVVGRSESSAGDWGLRFLK